jgi:hypothetical protein
VAWRKGRRGRPRKAIAKRRATTLAGRRPEVDRGSPELVVRKIAVANGSTVPVELVDVIGILVANELIVDEEVVALRLLSDWLRQAAVAFGLPQASPGGLWATLVAQAGRTGGWWAGQERPGGDRAMFRLGELFDYFGATDQLELLRFLIRVVGNEAPPENAHQLARLRYGAQIIMALQRRGRHTQVRRSAIPS